MKRAATSAPPRAVLDDDTFTVLPLGGAQEVGRSAILLKFKGRKVLLDCGIHPGRKGIDALPFLDTEDLSDIDLCLVSHFHIDHVAALPYLMEKTAFNGRVFMTHPTKAVMRMLLADYIRLDDSKENELYNEKDLQACVEKVELLDYHQVREHKGIKFWCYNAGHVLGAAMFMIEIAGVRILYTGDYSMEDDRHLMAAEVPSLKPDILICESTYGTQKHEPRESREQRFTQTVEAVVRRGGRCLIPVFALGRAQELLLILDEYWKAHPELQSCPVYYASKLASRALRVYQTYVNLMNAHIRRQMDVANPFRFAHISNLRSIGALNDSLPAVVFASPGMLQSGASRQLFDRWCSDNRNGVIIAGYSVEGTMAKALINEPQEVTGLDGRIRSRRCTVESVSFSAHVDYTQNFGFVRSTLPSHIVLVHGERNEMNKLSRDMKRDVSRWAEADRPNIFAPCNMQPVMLNFARDKRARAVGNLARAAAPGGGTEVDSGINGNRGRAVSGVLVSKDLTNELVDTADLKDFTSMVPHEVRQRMHVPFAGSPFLLLSFVQQIFGDIKIEPLLAEPAAAATTTTTTDAAPAETAAADTDAAAATDAAADAADAAAADTASTAPSASPGIRVSLHSGLVTLTCATNSYRVTLEWKTGVLADMLADAVVAAVMQAQCSPCAIQLTAGYTELDAAMDGVSAASEGTVPSTGAAAAATATVAAGVEAARAVGVVRRALAARYGDAAVTGGPDTTAMTDADEASSDAAPLAGTLHVAYDDEAATLRVDLEGGAPRVTAVVPDGDEPSDLAAAARKLASRALFAVFPVVRLTG